MPRITVKFQGKETVYDRAEDVTTIGRHEGNRLVVADATVSASHCRIEKGGGGFVLVDLGGKNGTRVNGVRVERHTLKAGDAILIGASTLVFHGAATKPGAAPPPAKRLLYVGQEERFVLDVATGKDAGKRFALNRERTSIGRGSECDLALNDPTASRLHAAVICTPLEFSIEDNNTRNGTEVNARRITQRCPLKHGDELRIGHTRIIFRDLASLAHRVETVAMFASQEPAPGLAPQEELPPVNGRSFVRQQEERRRARRRMQVLVGLVVVVVGAAGGLFAAWKYRFDLTFGLFKQKAGFVAVNLLTVNPNFEAGLVDNLPKGWSYSPGSEARWHAASLAGGVCLNLAPVSASDPNAAAEAVCDQRIKVKADKAYQLSARLRTEGIKGLALLKVNWLRDGDPGTTVLQSYSQPIWGEHDWQWLTGVFAPPDGATELQVALVGVANAQPVFFDDVTLYEGAVSESAPGVYHADVGKFRLCFDSKGLFCLRSDSKAGDALLLADGEARLEGRPGPVMRQAFATIEKGYPDARSPGWNSFSDWLVDTSTMTLVNVRLSTNPVQGGYLGLAYTLIGDKEQSRGASWVGTAFSLPAAVVEAGIGVGSGIETLTKTGEFKQASATSLVIGKGADRLVIDFANPYQIPMNLDCKRDGNRYVATVAMPLDAIQGIIQPMQRLEWNFTFGALSSKRAKDFVFQARETARAGEKVAALGIYQKLLDSDLFPDSDKQVARDEVKIIEDSIAKAITPVRNEIDVAIRKADVDELRVAEVDVKELKDKYGTTKFGAEIAMLQKQIEDFREGKTVKAEGDVVELMKKAKTSFEKEAWMVAKVFAENVIRKGGPNTDQAKEAQDLLAAIPKAREEAKARDEFVTKRLATAATFEKNNMPEKAAPIYDEILKKHPKFPRAAEIQGKLDEARKKAAAK